MVKRPQSINNQLWQFISEQCIRSKFVGGLFYHAAQTRTDRLCFRTLAVVRLRCTRHRCRSSSQAVAGRAGGPCGCSIGGLLAGSLSRTRQPTLLTYFGPRSGRSLPVLTGTLLTGLSRR